MLQALCDCLGVECFVVREKEGGVVCTRVGGMGGREVWILQVGGETHYRALGEIGCWGRS